MNALARPLAVLIGAAALLGFVAPPAAQEVGEFFRQQGLTRVLFQYTRDRFCHVQNQDQMEAYGGFGQIRVTDRFRMRGRSTGDCAWPNGFYRRRDQAAVYRLSGPGVLPNLGKDVCHVIDEKQMAAFGGIAQVVVVDPSSDLTRGRGPVTRCKSP